MEDNSRTISRLKRVFGITYFNQGFGGLSNIPIMYFIKYVLKMGDAGGQLFTALIGIGWLIKPLWGFISDRFPLWGYRRKSWFVVMALLASLSWVASAMLAYANIHSPTLFLIVFNLVFVGYAFVDVVCDAIMVENGRRLKKVGSFVNFQWTALAISGVIAGLMSGWFQEEINANNIHIGTVFLLCGIMPLIAGVVGWLNIDEEKMDGDSRWQKISTFIGNNDDNLLTMFICVLFYPSYLSVIGLFHTNGYAWPFSVSEFLLLCLASAIMASVVLFKVEIFGHYRVTKISATIFLFTVLLIKLSVALVFLLSVIFVCGILAVRHRKKIIKKVSKIPKKVIDYLTENKILVYLMLFIIAWNFSPSIGYIEWSYLEKVREITPISFGIFAAIDGVVFLLSIMVYRIVIKKFPGIQWYHYLYAMIGLWILAFPLSFFLYLDSSHPWWNYIMPLAPDLGSWNPLPLWTRYEWFKLSVGTILGFASIPAFLIPLTIAGESIKLANAGMYYAFLMALTNATNKVSGLIGGGLYGMFEQEKGQEGFTWAVNSFQGSWFDISGVMDERTLIIQMFIWIGLIFTALSIPFVRLLYLEFKEKKIQVNLGNS